MRGRILLLQAEGAAVKIGHFIKEIESQLGWTTQLPWSAGSIEQHRFDGLRLLRQVPAIAGLTQIDATGKERLQVPSVKKDILDSAVYRPPVENARPMRSGFRRRPGDR